jgi:hypothetical protein
MVNKNYYLANAGRPERVINKQQTTSIIILVYTFSCLITFSNDSLHFDFCSLSVDIGQLFALTPIYLHLSLVHGAWFVYILYCLHPTAVCLHLTAVCFHVTAVCLHLTAVCLHLIAVCLHLTAVCLHLTAVCLHLLTIVWTLIGRWFQEEL